ncbi:MAG: hypothetical protein PHO89_11190 [Methylacidiphilaceae bacterium]|nr:hypothetical protein [Candidatus Methylacidiphilaceae bacterium]
MGREGAVPRWREKESIQALRRLRGQREPLAFVDLLRGATHLA